MLTPRAAHARTIDGPSTIRADPGRAEGRSFYLTVLDALAAVGPNPIERTAAGHAAAGTAIGGTVRPLAFA
jgi:hypothetical protein